MTSAPLDSGAQYRPFDSLSVGVCIFRDHQLVYMNESLGTLLGYPRDTLLGRPEELLLAELGTPEMDARNTRWLQGELVPSTLETWLRTASGLRRVEMTRIPNGPDWVLLVREVTTRARRRTVLQQLAELGAALPALRTEGEVLRRVFSGMEELGLGFAWLTPEGTGLRLGQTFIAPGMVPPQAPSLGGRWMRDIVGQWSPVLARAWRESAAFGDDLKQEVAQFLAGGQADVVSAALRQAAALHAIAVRIDMEGRPRALLVVVAEWLSEEELPPVRLFGAQVSAALDAALTISRLYSQNTALAALNRLASEAASAPHPRALFGAGTQEIVGLLGCDAVTVLLPTESGGLELSYARGLEPETATRFPATWREAGMSGESPQDESVVVKDLEDGPEPLRAKLWQQGFQTLVAVPLRARSRAVGTLGVLFRERRPLSALERETLLAMGSHFAAAIESHRLLHELRIRADDLALLHEVGKAFADTLELDKLLHIGVTSLSRITDGPDTYIILPDATGERLEIRAGTGSHPELVGRYLLMDPPHSSLAGLMLQTREIVMVEDAVEDPRINQELRQLAGGLAYLGLPLVVHERAIGAALVVETRRARRFDPAEVERASAIANQLALALTGAQLVEDLKRSYAELARTQEQLVNRERLAALGELSAVVAHEVRNPLGAIFNSVASIRRIVGTQSQAVPLLDIVSEEADRLNRIVADLLTFARPPSPHTDAVPLEPVVEDAVRSALADTGVQVKVELALDMGVPPVAVDERMIRQAFLNLALNAVQAMPHGGTLRVALRRSPFAPEVEVEFTDTGPGISPEVRARIFEPFFTTKAKGTGLGLAVVKRIVESHLGRLALDPQRPGAGATFRVYLPVEPALPSP